MIHPAIGWTTGLFIFWTFVDAGFNAGESVICCADRSTEGKLHIGKEYTVLEYIPQQTTGDCCWPAYVLVQDADNNQFHVRASRFKRITD